MYKCVKSITVCYVFILIAKKITGARVDHEGDRSSALMIKQYESCLFFPLLGIQCTSGTHCVIVCTVENKSNEIKCNNIFNTHLLGHPSKELKSTLFTLQSNIHNFKNASSLYDNYTVFKV